MLLPPCDGGEFTAPQPWWRLCSASATTSSEFDHTLDGTLSIMLLCWPRPPTPSTWLSACRPSASTTSWFTSVHGDGGEFTAPQPLQLWPSSMPQWFRAAFRRLARSVGSCRSLARSWGRSRATGRSVGSCKGLGRSRGRSRAAPRSGGRR